MGPSGVAAPSWLRPWLQGAHPEFSPALRGAQALVNAIPLLKIRTSVCCGARGSHFVPFSFNLWAVFPNLKIYNVYLSSCVML